MDPNSLFVNSNCHLSEARSNLRTRARLRSIKRGKEGFGEDVEAVEEKQRRTKGGGEETCRGENKMMMLDGRIVFDGRIGQKFFFMGGLARSF